MNVVVPPGAPAAVAPTAARLQLRLPDGRALTQTFGAREQLSAVRLYLEINEMKDTPFGLMTTFPRRVFVEEDYDKPLDFLGEDVFFQNKEFHPYTLILH